MSASAKTTGVKSKHIEGLLVKVAEWPELLIDALAAVTSMGGDIYVQKNGEIAVEYVNRYDDVCNQKLAFNAQVATVESLIRNANEIMFDAEEVIQARRAAEEKQKLKEAALAKLTPDEKEALGL